MATYKPELHNIDAVLSYYDQYEESSYQVFAGHKPEAAYCRFTYSGNDKGIGREKLLEALQSVVSNPDNTNTYLLQICTAKSKKLEPINSITFQLNKPQSFYPVHNNYNSGNDVILAKLNAIEQRINLIEEDEEDEEDNNDDNLGGLGALWNTPEIKTLIMQGLMSAFTKKTPQTMAVAGIPENEIVLNTKEDKLKVALEILQKNVPNLEDKLLKLANMSIEEPTKFKMLLTFL